MLLRMRRLFCVTMSLLLLFSLNLWSGMAVSAEENTIQPRYSYTAYTSTAFTEGSNGALTCIAEAEGYSGVTTKVHIKMELQRHTMIKWETVATWESTFNNYYGILSKTKTLTEGGLCRVKATYTVYSGSAYETITGAEAEAMLRIALEETAEENFAEAADQPVTRGQAARMLYRAAKLAEDAGETEIA